MVQNRTETYVEMEYTTSTTWSKLFITRWPTHSHLRLTH